MHKKKSLLPFEKNSQSLKSTLSSLFCNKMIIKDKIIGKNSKAGKGKRGRKLQGAHYCTRHPPPFSQCTRLYSGIYKNVLYLQTRVLQGLSDEELTIQFLHKNTNVKKCFFLSHNRSQCLVALSFYFYGLNHKSVHIFPD